MTGPRSWPRRVRDRLGDRGLAIALLLVLVAVAFTPLVAFPAVRCEVFGKGCPRTIHTLHAEPVTSPQAVPLTPEEAATRGAYVALGDSYSSGLGAETSVADHNPLNRCHRTSNAYYHDVAKAFRFAGGTAFWACSGATTADVLDGKSGEPAQLGRVNGDTSLVTISIGGNDVGFSRVLAGCVVKLPWSRACQDQGGDIAARMAELRRTLPGLIDKITDRAPRARVVVMGYPRMFSEVDNASGDNIDVADQRWLNARARDLNELIRQAVREADERLAAARAPGSVEFVDAYSAFAGHEAGSLDPYMNGLAVNLAGLSAEPRSFHPTVKGHRALAALFVEQIRKGPGRPLNQFR
ncbi:SGNH/GDSL hydrolase family protein [Actinomadura miaoliensis]|uniref:SGNH/GDSL hydrolase family protein n=1 Tax=Actinomadura miaoliensis TaxID=430685 RepID=A0ABP7W948_9ACTN